MTDFYQAHNDADNNLDDSTNFHQISNVSEYESASNLFDEVNHTKVGGVTRASATLDDGLVSYEGMQLPRSVAEDMGLIPRTAPSDINYKLNNAVKTETVTENTDSANDILADLPMLSESQTTLLDQAIAYDGGAVDKAISDVLAYGDLSDNTLSDLVRASGGDVDSVNKTIADVSLNLDAQVETLSGITEASELLRLASEAQPKMVKASLMSAINGDVSSALDLVKSTYANLDKTSYRASLVETLKAANYQTIDKQGNLYLIGNDLAEPTAWSTASSLFTINFAD